ncbi:MAG: AAA family ATPase [candidate division Zixibacteria bacterium]|nr:AAA family ATPase [candidate division Zixibacteria bacterium]
MIVLVGGIKGGSGKTTIATHLAILRAASGADVLLVDADDQGTASQFTAMRNEKLAGQAGYTGIQLSGMAVRTEIVRLKSKYDDIIIDSGGRDTGSQRAGLTVADLMLVPCLPRSFDIWTLAKTADLIRQMLPANPNLRVSVFLSRTDPSSLDSAEAAEALKDAMDVMTFIASPVGARKAFSQASAAGLSVTEFRPRNEKAVAEITTLYDNVFGK